MIHPEVGSLYDVTACNIEKSHRHIAVLLRRVAHALVAAAVQGSDYGSAGVGGLDDVIYIAQFGSKVRVCEFVLVFLYACGNVFGLLLAVKYAHGSLGTHHGNLGAWICKVDVRTYLLGIHHDICSAISLAGDEGDFRDGGLCKSIDDFSTVTYDSGVFLLYARQEARNEDERKEQRRRERHSRGWRRWP